MSKRNKWFIWFLFIIYIVGMTYLLFFAESYGRTNISGYRYNLKPFSEIRRFIVYYRTLGIWNVIVNLLGNIAAFVPMGLFLPLISPKCKKALFTFCTGLLIDVCIETIQLLCMVGSFDVDDMILNMFGVIIGYIWYRIWARGSKRESR